MLRISLLSIAIGTGLALLLAGLELHSPAAGSADIPVLEWGADDIEANKKRARVEDGLLHIDFVHPYASSLALPHAAADAQSYPFLRLELEHYPEDLKIGIAWGKSQGKFPAFGHTITSEVRPVQWLAVRELENWHGDLGNLRISLASQTGDSVSVRNISLHPASLKSTLLTLWSDWTSFSPWRRASMNSNLGVTKLSPTYPTIVIGGVFLLSLAAYAALHLVWYRKNKLNWGAIGLVFLFCWIPLDMLWQYKLLRQNIDTSELFTGKTSEEKLLAGPDAKLYSLIQEVKQLIPEDTARIFVASSDDYTGLRAAYYLYPHNVYFMLHGRELPYSITTKPGDYVLIVPPSRVKLNYRDRVLAFKRDYFAGEVLLAEPYGKLMRLSE